MVGDSPLMRAPRTGRLVAQVTDAVKSFRSANDPVRGLQGFSIELYAGELCALVGVSGSGKSTLLNVLGGLVKLDSGTARVGDVDLSTLTGEALSRYRSTTTAYVFQEYNLLPMLTNVENVALAGYLATPDYRSSESHAREALRLLGLAEQADRYPGELSGGQRQRVAIARAIAGVSTAGKRLLLADEPSGSLDSTTTMEVMAALTKAAEAGLAVLVATHDPQVVAACDRVVTIRDGRNVAAEVAEAVGVVR